METFKQFDKVFHSVYGIGRVHAFNPKLKLIEAIFPFAGGVMYVEVSPKTLTKTD